MKRIGWLGVLLILASFGLLRFAWFGGQPGGKTIEQRVIDGKWETVRYEDESLPVRWGYTAAAAGMFAVGAAATGITLASGATGRRGSGEPVGGASRASGGWRKSRGGPWELTTWRWTQMRLA
jgi:hypothetical protein